MSVRTLMLMPPFLLLLVFLVFFVVVLTRQNAKAAVALVAGLVLLPVTIIIAGALLFMLYSRISVPQVATPLLSPPIPAAAPRYIPSPNEFLPSSRLLAANGSTRLEADNEEGSAVMVINTGKPEPRRPAAKATARSKRGDSKAGSPPPAKSATQEKPSVAAEKEPVQAEKETLLAEKDSTSSATEQEPSKPADDRPSWVDAEPFKEGDVYKWPITLDPRASQLEAEEELLPAAANTAIAEYVEKKLKLDADYLRHRPGGDWPYLSEVWVRNHMIGSDVWAEPVNVSFGRWVRLHALLKFDRPTNDSLRQRWREMETFQRLGETGGLLAGLLVVLAVAWAYLRLDLATAGQYRWRLRLAAATIILALVFVGMRMS